MCRGAWLSAVIRGQEGIAVEVGDGNPVAPSEELTGMQIAMHGHDFCIRSGLERLACLSEAIGPRHECVAHLSIKIDGEETSVVNGQGREIRAAERVREDRRRRGRGRVQTTGEGSEVTGPVGGIRCSLQHPPDVFEHPLPSVMRLRQEGCVGRDQVVSPDDGSEGHRHFREARVC